MSVVMICGSPNMKNSNSMYLLNGLKSMLKTEAEIYRTKGGAESAKEAAAAAVRNNSPIVFAFPLYADQLPSDFLRFLFELESEIKKISTESKVYVIVQNGFYDARQNNIAVRIVKKWCEKCGLIFGQAAMIGAGGMMQAAPLGKGPSAKTGAVIEKLARSIDNDKVGETLSAEPMFPRFLYKAAGNMGFTKMGKDNGLGKTDIKRAIL